MYTDGAILGLYVASRDFEQRHNAPGIELLFVNNHG
jgi:hypothetical protein